MKRVIRPFFALAFLATVAGNASTATLSEPLKGMKICLDPGHGGAREKLYIRNGVIHNIITFSDCNEGRGGRMATGRERACREIS